MTLTDQQLTPAEIRLAQYGQRTSTWSTATYNAGAEKALYEIALDLKDEVDRLRDRVAGLEAFAYGCDAEGCVLPHSSWCEAAKKTAAENNGCTCGQPWTGHPQPHAMHCWTVNPPRNEIEEMRKRIAELTAGQPAPARTLTELEHDRAWHAIEGAAGEEGADPGTVLNAVLRALRLNPPAEESHVVADDSDDPEHIDDCPGCAPAPARSAAV